MKAASVRAVSVTVDGSPPASLQAATTYKPILEGQKNKKFF